MVSFPKPRLPRTFKSLTVNENSHDTRWSNPDIVPVPLEQRRYTSKAFFGYWYGPSSYCLLPATSENSTETTLIARQTLLRRVLYRF